MKAEINHNKNNHGIEVVFSTKKPEDFIAMQLGNLGFSCLSSANSGIQSI